MYAGLGVCYSPVVAAARGDGKRRLYAGSYSLRALYEISFEDGAWRSTAVEGSAIDRVVGVRAAEARNDGITRLYMSHGAAGPEGDCTSSAGTAPRAPGSV
ncbi:MAG: hypothetical protein JXP34_15585 [Planctomycetes bacterium]|nr:hypothetical protein [Planctomycetota bacterium]